MNQIINLHLFVFFNIVFLLPVQAQTPAPVFRHYTIEDGLPSSQVYQALQDADGYMWFATDRGVVKYNGYEFKTFTTEDGLTDNVVFNLFQDDTKRIWMISFSGNIFIYQSSKITAYKYNSSIRDFIKGSFQLSIYVDSADNVFVGSNFGEFIIDRKGKIVQRFKGASHSGINKLFIDEQYDFKPADAKGQVSKTNAPTDLFHLTKSGTDSIRLTLSLRESIRAVRLKSNVLLFSVGNILFELKNKSVVQLVELPADVINLFEDKNHRLWVCTKKGLYLFYKPGNYVLNYHYLTDKYIGNINEDKEGGYWIATNDDGVNYLVNDAVKNYISDTKLKYPLAFTSDKSTIYAGYLSGSLARINTNDLNLIINDTSGKFIDCIFYDTLTSRLYIGNNGQRYLHGNSFFPLAAPESGSRIGFVKTKHGIFTGGFSALSKIAGDSTHREVDFKTRINCIYSNEKDELLLGCIDGVYKYDYAHKTISLINYQLKDVRVDDIESLNGNLCFATQGKGLMIMMQDSSFKTINVSNGLCNNIIRKIKVSNNKIWCASFKGISEITFTDLDNFKFNITNISVNEGLISNEINDITTLNDTVWVASKKGLSFFYSNTDFINHAPPLVHFISFQVNSIDTLVKDNYRFPHTYNTISIGFESPLFKSDGKQNYQYLLTNADDSIKGITTNRSVQFLSLKPADYSLYVKAMNNSGVWSEQPATLHFTILAPWWQTWWFRLIVLMVIAALSFAFYKSRVKKLKEKYDIEMKQASLQLTAMRAQMNPHFIFNAMSSIRHYMQNNDNASAEKYLTSFAKLVRYTLDNSEIQEVTLEEELEALRNYSLLEMKRLKYGFDFDVRCEEGIEMNDTMMPSLLLQPFVENAIKHGIEQLDTKGRIVIEIKKEGDTILIAIEDNGVGRMVASQWNETNRGKHTSHGSKITFERIETFNKAFNRNIKAQIIDLTDTDNNSCGTRVEILL